MLARVISSTGTGVSESKRMALVVLRAVGRKHADVSDAI